MNRRPDKDPSRPAPKPRQQPAPDHSIGSDYGGLRGTEGAVQDEVRYGRRGAPVSTPDASEDAPPSPSSGDGSSRG